MKRNGESVRRADRELAAIPRCPSTNVTKPECSCPRCQREQVQKHAPGVLAA